MYHNLNPSFGKKIIPWYDSNSVCFIVLFFTFLTFFFGIEGIAVALEYTNRNDYIWVPVMLAVSSSIVFISIAYRLIIRYTSDSSR